MCFQWPFNSHSMLIRYILQSINIFVFKCKRPVNHSGGMLISPDSCDNQKLWCKSRLYPAILSAEIISFTRDASSFYPSTVPHSPCPLGVSLISSLFFQHGHGWEGWVLCTYCRGVCILAGLSILFLLSPPPAPVSSCAARTLPLASHLPPLFTLPMGTQHIPEPPIAPVRKWYQGLVTTNNPAQPWTKCSWRYTGRAASLEVGVLWFLSNWPA